MSPQRIQLRRTKGWRKPEGVVLVTRPGRWGNPYSIGDCCRTECDIKRHWHVYDTGGDTEVGYFETKAEATHMAVILYRDGIDHGWGSPARSDIVEHLAGHDLACWCPLDQPCHADVLLEIANAS